MADYTNTKEGYGRLYPDNSVAVQFEDLEPLITPERLRTEHLLGIPLVSGSKDPITGKFHVVTDPEIKTFITNAVALAELESKISIFPKQIQEGQPFDRCEYVSWGYFQLRHRPVSSIEELTIVTSDGSAIYQVPLAWINVQYLHQGILNILPLLMAMKDGQVQPLLASPGGSAFLALFSSQSWIPAFWQVLYSVGFKDGLIPKTINQYIGTIAAMELLSQLAGSFARSTSTSLSFDGLAQGISGLGPTLYNNFLEQLASKRKWLLTRLKAQFNQSIILGNV
jgi:hypothetical protein